MQNDLRERKGICKFLWSYIIDDLKTQSIIYVSSIWTMFNVIKVESKKKRLDLDWLMGCMKRSESNQSPSEGKSGKMVSSEQPTTRQEPKRQVGTEWKSWIEANELAGTSERESVWRKWRRRRMTYKTSWGRLLRRAGHECAHLGDLKTRPIRNTGTKTE